MLLVYESNFRLLNIKSKFNGRISKISLELLVLFITNFNRSNEDSLLHKITALVGYENQKSKYQKTLILWRDFV